MEQIRELLYGFNVWSVLIRIVSAAVIGGLIGSERGRHGRAAGLRTHILVCVGATMTSLTGLFVSETGISNGDVLRISAQVVSGIGFLGAGTILVRNKSVVTGLTTAAGMWMTAAIGIALGYGFYFGSVIAAVICIFSFTVLSIFERKRKQTTHLYVEITDILKTGEVAEKIKNLGNKLTTVEVIAPKSGCVGNVGLLCCSINSNDASELKGIIRGIDSVAFVLEENSY